ncbi:TetR family transcriptional regulator [Actinocorallia libanotica]|uniref:HTH tetR-type domain-containing protein n=1 Tax=Actinocorallia libanotica TaxID=46162 RepID=A0ABP4BAT0_9ACTN
MATGGLREIKKQRTRLALVDAALGLFLDRGYANTTIDEIAAAAEVSQRTFFRYFATKEDVITGLLGGSDAQLVERVRARPADEPVPLSLLAAMRELLDVLRLGDPAQLERMRRLHLVLESNTCVVAAYLTRHAETSGRLAAELARRMGADHRADLRPRLLASIYLGALRVGFEDCASRGVFDPPEVAKRVEESVTLALGALREDWISSSG